MNNTKKNSFILLSILLPLLAAMAFWVSSGSSAAQAVPLARAYAARSGGCPQPPREASIEQSGMGVANSTIVNLKLPFNWYEEVSM